MSIFVVVPLLLLHIYLQRFCNIRRLRPECARSIIDVRRQNGFICSMIYVYPIRCLQIIIRHSLFLLLIFFCFLLPSLVDALVELNCWSRAHNIYIHNLYIEWYIENRLYSNIQSREIDRENERRNNIMFYSFAFFFFIFYVTESLFIRCFFSIFLSFIYNANASAFVRAPQHRIKMQGKKRERNIFQFNIIISLFSSISFSLCLSIYIPFLRLFASWGLLLLLLLKTASNVQIQFIVWTLHFFFRVRFFPIAAIIRSFHVPLVASLCLSLNGRHRTVAGVQFHSLFRYNFRFIKIAFEKKKRIFLRHSRFNRLYVDTWTTKRSQHRTGNSTHTHTHK